MPTITFFCHLGSHSLFHIHQSVHLSSYFLVAENVLPSSDTTCVVLVDYALPLPCVSAFIRYWTRTFYMARNCESTFRTQYFSKSVLFLVPNPLNRDSEGAALHWSKPCVFPSLWRTHLNWFIVVNLNWKAVSQTVLHTNFGWQKSKYNT